MLDTYLIDKCELVRLPANKRGILSLSVYSLAIVAHFGEILLVHIIKMVDFLQAYDIGFGLLDLLYYSRVPVLKVLQDIWLNTAIVRGKAVHTGVAIC